MTTRARPTRARRSAAWWSAWAPVAALAILATLVQISTATANPSVRVAARRSPPSPADHALGNAVNAEIFPLVNQLVKSPFFRYVKVDLHKPCPFWKENFKCMNQDCVVQVMDEGKVRTEAPFMYQDVNLGDVKPMPAALGGSAPSGRGALGGSGPAAPGGLNFFSQCQFAKDFCVLEDESSANGEYVDLQENPERFTGYSGAPANNVWKAIYQENCFTSPVAGGHHGAPGSALDAPDDLCEEKQVFHQIISGLHASISVHICAEYLNKTTGQWQRHPKCYQYRVGNFPDRVHNVYVVYSLLLRAMAKLEPYLASQLDICTGKPKDDAAVQTALAHLAGDLAPRYALDASRLFQGPHRTALMDEVRTRFRNVSRIMDCVSCQKCRLWGKTQVTGIGTALKVVFGLSDDMIAGKVSSPTGKPLLSRFEVVALLNTLNRFAESVRDIVAFEEELARDTAQKQTEEIAVADTNQSVKEPMAAGTKPNATARDGGSDNDEHLFLWKSIASALTIAPFLFGWWYSMQGGGAGGNREPDESGKSRSQVPPRSSTSRTSPRHVHHPVAHDLHDDTDTDDALDAFAHQVNQDANDADSDDEFSSSGLDMSSSGDEQETVPSRPASAGMSAATRRRLVVDAGYEGSVDTSEADEDVVRASGKRSAAARRRPRRVD
ncbi:hypothetical protein AMAG_17042 [Allomyces macrogynus ATCC 38327]|uniref:Endoplasmic oxidoreductin-1 n=1 Tax=Allomyces macrogynus (strain ATCC 38327) TaxID=578462 RepID=A0A0L0TDF9_ALLM3|nr:hypothetical protein AMAG_17042 [Allomyces macrogynus ATCC 38327]|eukprot:KNE72599.1 hypothetical protein AMAG_17042 [Allomyces macrogynus ATCC 38327]